MTRGYNDLVESGATGCTLADVHHRPALGRRYDYNSLDLEVAAHARGVLYWAEGYDPPSRAWVDCAEVAVRRANLAFKAIFVLPGRHAVRFEYRPTTIVVTGLLFVALGVRALASPPRLPGFGGRA